MEVCLWFPLSTDSCSLYCGELDDVDGWMDLWCSVWCFVGQIVFRTICVSQSSCVCWKTRSHNLDNVDFLLNVCIDIWTNEQHLWDSSGIWLIIEWSCINDQWNGGTSLFRTFECLDLAYELTWSIGSMQFPIYTISCDCFIKSPMILLTFDRPHLSLSISLSVSLSLSLTFRIARLQPTFRWLFISFPLCITHVHLTSAITTVVIIFTLVYLWESCPLTWSWHQWRQ